MKKKLNSILLVDDDEDCNFFHKRLINRMDITEEIHVALDGEEALEYLKSTIDGKHPQPAIIFLDINMPKIDGWEFLDEYEKLEDIQKAQVVLVMLTTSLNPDDLERAKRNPLVHDYLNKYLDSDRINKIIEDHFSGHV